MIKKLEEFFEAKKLKKIEDLVEKTESLSHEDSILQVLEDLDLPSKFKIQKGYIILDIHGDYATGYHVVDGPSDDMDLSGSNKLSDEEKLFKCISISEHGDDDDDMTTNRYINGETPVDSDFIQKRLDELTPKILILKSLTRISKICPSVLIQTSENTLGYDIILK